MTHLPKPAKEVAALTNVYCQGRHICLVSAVSFSAFVQKSVVLLADVEKAFLQLQLFPADRDVTRFLWLKEPQKGFSKDNIKHYRFKRVPYGIVSSPFLLNATIRHHLQTIGTATRATDITRYLCRQCNDRNKKFS